MTVRMTNKLMNLDYMLAYMNQHNIIETTKFGPRITRAKVESWIVPVLSAVASSSPHHPYSYGTIAATNKVVENYTLKVYGSDFYLYQSPLEDKYFIRSKTALANYGIIDKSVVKYFQDKSFSPGIQEKHKKVQFKIVLTFCLEFFDPYADEI